MDENRRDILALIPAYNEAAHIQAVVQAVLPHIPVLVVDDGSQDQTAHLAEEAGAQVIRQVPNQGKGAALRAGFRQALEADQEAVITLDADGQHAPDEIPKFLKRFAAQGADLIIGARDFAHMPWQRRISNTFGRWTFSWAMRRPIPDNQSGYRLLSRRMMAALLDSQETGFEFEVEMIVTCVLRGYALDWVPIQTIYAGEASHIRPWQHSVNYLRLVWQTRDRVSRGLKRNVPQV
jgi:glycosyltransferase involved in cell wall biosynthesis